MPKNPLRKIKSVGSGLSSHGLSLSLLICLLLAVVGCGQEPLTTFSHVTGDTMAEANHLYENRDFDGAADIYQSLLDTGVDDAAVYYNLGNAYFKRGDLGWAIVNYKRAQRLSPRDPDIEANLLLARAQTRDQLEREGNGLAGFINYMLVGWSSFDEVASVTLGLWIVLCGCTVLMLSWRRQRVKLRWMMIVLTICLVICVFSLGMHMVNDQQAHAVIVSPSIEVRSGPGPGYLVEFTLHSGTEVRVLEYRSTWARISLPGNLQGWVPDQAVEEL